MNKNLKFAIWIVSAFLAAFVIGRFVTPGQVNQPSTSPYAGRGRISAQAGAPSTPTTSTVPTVPSGTSGTSATPPAASGTTPTTGAAASGSIAASGAICTTLYDSAPVNTARGPRTAEATTIPVSALYQLIDKSSQLRRRCDFLQRSVLGACAPFRS